MKQQLLLLVLLFSSLTAACNHHTARDFQFVRDLEREERDRLKTQLPELDVLLLVAQVSRTTSSPSCLNWDTVNRS